MTFLNARSAPSGVSSASTSRAVSMNRCACAGSSGFGFGLRPIIRLYQIASFGGTLRCYPAQEELVQ